MEHNGSKAHHENIQEKDTKWFQSYRSHGSLAISSVLITAVYQTFHSQQRSYTMQNEAAAMEQNLRGSLYLLTKELRSAGYNPQQTPTDSSVPTTNFRFVTSFPAPNNLFTVDYTKHSMVAFTLDSNGDGTIASTPNNNEQIAYRFNNAQKTLERFNDITNQWEIASSNIDAVYFTYFDQSKNPTANPANIEYVEISLLARTGKPDSKYTNTHVYTNKDGTVNLCPACAGDHYHRRLLTTTIQIRNKLVTAS